MGKYVIDLVEAITELDQHSDLHAARLLLLLFTFAEGPHGNSIEGLTKLAKLDFLLRYPLMLERALVAKHRSASDVQIEDHERFSVESQMVRYRFGPWDHRYREFLNILTAKELASVSVEGRTFVISITDKGRGCARRVSADQTFEPYLRRAALLKRHFDLTATNLMRFIYDTFPEVVSLRSNDPIVA